MCVCKCRPSNTNIGPATAVDQRSIAKLGRISRPVQAYQHAVNMGKGKGRSKADGGGNAGILDRALVPRIENYAMNNELDLDDVVEYLRSAYREYQRQKLAPFRLMVERAILVAKRRGQSKPELQIQAWPRPPDHDCGTCSSACRSTCDAS